MLEDQLGHVSPNLVNPMTKVNLPIDDIQITSIDFLNLPSPHITPQHMLSLYKMIKEKEEAFDGVVITHGTDTLEETAYFLDSLTLPNIPIVLTGAMRSANELGSDGIYNYLCALRVAAHDHSAGKGVLVVMNDEIYAAKYVTKTHTTNVSTFQAPSYGPLGLITKQEILFFKRVDRSPRFDLEGVSGLVPIIKAYTGMDGTLFHMLDTKAISGLVIEALGAGNLPPQTIKPLNRLIEAGIPVVLVSRCFNGIAGPVYAYEGGGVTLQKAGVLFVKEINAQKARLKLLIALNAGLKGDKLKAYIEG